MSEKGHHLAGAVVSLGKESAGTKTGSGGAGTSRSWEPTALPCSHLPAFRSSSSISYWLLLTENQLTEGKGRFQSPRWSREGGR